MTRTQKFNRQNVIIKPICRVGKSESTLFYETVNLSGNSFSLIKTIKRMQIKTHIVTRRKVAVAFLQRIETYVFPNTLVVNVRPMNRD